MPHDFIENFRTYCSELESPDVFINMTARLTMASVIDRKLSVTRAYHTFDTGVYNLMVGPAGLGKTTAIDRGVEMIDQVGVRGERLIEGASTSRALMNKIEGFNEGEEYTPATIFADEAVDFFGLSKEAMIGFLTAAYNVKRDYIYETANYGKVKIPKPYVVFNGNCTIPFVEGEFRSDLLDGGFGRRCIFTFAEKKRFSNPNPELKAENFAAFDKCVQRLNEIERLEGKFQLTEEAKDWIDTWYVENDEIEHGVLYNYFVGKRVHLYKFAMLESVSRKNELILEKEDFERANEFLKPIEEGMTRVFRAIGKNKNLALSLDIKDFLKGKGVVKRTLINKAFQHKADVSQIGEALINLKECGDIDTNVNAEGSFVSLLNSK